MADSSLEKLQGLLKIIFQFDCADLDFGIYRILNYKRDRIEEFLTKDLPKAVRSELDRGALAAQSQAAKSVQMLQKEICEAMGDDAIDGEGNLAEAYHATPLGKKYLEARAAATGAKSRTALEGAIFSHLCSFFSRYYSDGDFMSKRRYSRREKYAIPYNGEEVYLHWANSDQYYVKTEEYFRDYSFKSRGVTIHFRIQNAQLEQDNVKGDKRFFIPLVKQASFDAKAKEILIPFEFRPLTTQEEIAHGKRNQQETITVQALEAITKHFKKGDRATAALSAERRKRSDGTSVSCLEHHLRQYTRRNTSDFFIHKDLKGFLERELDFYLKNEVLNLDDLEAAGEERADGWFQMLRVIRGIGTKIIAFLAQIEDFQKRLFEKRKLVTETDYCITVSNVPEESHEEVAANEAQWAEWRELFHIDEKKRGLFTAAAKAKKARRLAFLKVHPTLVLDTRHFDADFVDRLLGSFEDLDGMTDGLLIHSENFQAINLLLAKYHEKVNCVYIDPPYNTGNDEFIYKDSYQHSSWLAMLADRTALSMPLLASQGNLLVSCDDGEEHRLRLMLDAKFNIPRFMANLVWKSRQNVDSRPKNNISNDHEFILAYGVALRGGAKSEKKYSNPDNDPRGPWMSDNMVGLATRRGRPNLHFHLLVGRPSKITETATGYRLTINKTAITVPHGLVVGEKLDPSSDVCVCVSIELDEAKAACNIPRPLDRRSVIPSLYECPNKGWRYDPPSMARKVVDTRILWPDNPSGRPRKKTYLKELRSDFTGFSSVVGFTRDGTSDLASLFGADVGISFPKPVSLLKALVQQGCDTSDLIMDYFAGSGTTAHAVIRLNQEDGQRRRFVLVELAGHFDSILLPRVKKVTFAVDWKDGKPKRMATEEEGERGPRIVKYIRLESYEDALNNISFTLPKGQQVLGFEEYLLKYMLEWETAKSDTFLNVEKLASPFSYKLVLTEGQETHGKPVDLPETFNYLLGLHVKSRRAYDDGGRRYLVYRGTVDHKDVVVIWRKTEGWKKKDLERDKKFVAEQKLAEGADEVFVNGDSFIPEAKALDPVFKHRMFGGV